METTQFLKNIIQIPSSSSPHQVKINHKALSQVVLHEEYSIYSNFRKLLS